MRRGILLRGWRVVGTGLGRGVGATLGGTGRRAYRSLALLSHFRDPLPRGLLDKTGVLVELSPGPAPHELFVLGVAPASATGTVNVPPMPGSKSLVAVMEARISEGRMALGGASGVPGLKPPRACEM